jgi:acyl carrier protein
MTALVDDRTGGATEDLEHRIRAQMAETAALTGGTLVDPVTDDTVLLESGLDSLGFATLVVSLEEDLGFDPFAMRSDLVYPRTFGEFVGIYRDAADQLAGDGAPG